MNKLLLVLLSLGLLGIQNHGVLAEDTTETNQEHQDKAVTKLRENAEKNRDHGKSAEALERNADRIEAKREKMRKKREAHREMMEEKREHRAERKAEHERKHEEKKAEKEAENHQENEDHGGSHHH